MTRHWRAHDVIADPSVESITFIHHLRIGNTIQHSKTSEFRRHNVEMYASAVIAFTHLYTYDLDL